MAIVTPRDAVDTLLFRDEGGAEHVRERRGLEAVDAFFAFVAERRDDSRQVFTIELEPQRAGLRFDFDRGAIARYRHFFADDGVTLERTFEDYSLIEDEERSRVLVRALIDDGFGGPYPLAAWMPAIPRLPEVADDDPDASEFVMRSASGASQVLRIAHPNDATYLSAAFLARHADSDVRIESTETGDRLDILRESSLIVRAAGVDGAGSDARAEFLKIEQPQRIKTAVTLFFEDGFAGLEHFGPWASDAQELDLPPAQRGRYRAASFRSEAEMLREIGRIWVDSGIVDPSDRFWVFFESRSIDEDQVERAELLALLERLGLAPASSPDGAETGEVWVAREPRLDAEIDNWA